MNTRGAVLLTTISGTDSPRLIRVFKVLILNKDEGPGAPPLPSVKLNRYS